MSFTVRDSAVKGQAVRSGFGVCAELVSVTGGVQLAYDRQPLVADCGVCGLLLVSWSAVGYLDFAEAHAACGA